MTPATPNPQTPEVEDFCEHDGSPLLDCGCCSLDGCRCDDGRWDDDDDGGYCYTCYGQGFIVTCIDDICRGGGECIHGDGEEICPECKGKYL